MAVVALVVVVGMLGSTCIVGAVTLAIFSAEPGSKVLAVRSR